MRLISFSVYGKDAKYISGAHANVELSKSIYPGWQLLFQCGRSVPQSTLDLMVRAGALVIRIEKPEGHASMFWRFQIPMLPRLEYVIFRDTDSRLSFRESSAVEEWIQSGKTLHIMRDHVSHNTSILGGMWGLRSEGLNLLRDELAHFSPVGYYGEDQEFLAATIYQKFRNSSYVHDSFFRRERHRRPFPTTRFQNEFVGESFSADGRCDEEARLKLRNVEKSKQKMALVAIRDFISRRLMNLS